MKKLLIIFMGFMPLWWCYAMPQTRSDILKVADQSTADISAALSNLSDTDIAALSAAINKLKNISTKPITRDSLSDDTVIGYRTGLFLQAIGAKLSQAAKDFFKQVVKDAFAIEQATLDSKGQLQTKSSLAWSPESLLFFDRVLCLLNNWTP